MTWDVLVVGGGIAGVSVAAELAEHRSVLLVEGEPELARHTTGRSAAVYLPSYGGPLVRALTAASRPLFGDGLLSPRPTVWVGVERRPVPAEPITTAEALRLCPVLRPDRIGETALDPDTMDIDVMALHQGYVRRLRERGAIRLNAPLTALRRDGDGWTATIGQEDSRVTHVVNAAGAWADKIAALAGVPTIGLRPLRRTIAVAAGGTPVDPTWPLVSDAGDRFYFRPESQGVLISPADETPTEPLDAKPDELDVALAVERVNEATTLALRTVRTAWAGLRSFVADREPVVGEPDGHPGFAFFAGQGGYGIQMAPALARAGADLVLGKPHELAERLSPNRLLNAT